jgi:hypothetical protein
VQRFASGSIPDDGGFALIGDANGVKMKLIGAQLRLAVSQAVAHRGQQNDRILFRPTEKPQRALI